MIANLCIMEGVFTWHSPGLSVVFCCNGGERRGKSREKPRLRQWSVVGELVWLSRADRCCGAAGCTERTWIAFANRCGGQADDKSVSEVCKAVAEDLGNA